MQSLTFEASDGQRVQVLHWAPAVEPIAVVQIAHGMGEHAARYDWTAQRLSAAGFAVYANDHRGHGRTATRDRYGELGPDGWNRVIADALELSALIRSNHPGVALVVLGHSMGSVLCQQYIARAGGNLAGVILSGSPGFPSQVALWMNHLAARFERWRLGPHAFSPLLRYWLFGRSNRRFDSPSATGFEWLSRDTQQVRAFVDDPMTGFTLRTGSLCDLAEGARSARRHQTLERIPATLPVWVFSGSMDPFYGTGRNLDRMVSAYRSLGLSVQCSIYPQGRHEMLNETNREAVIGDLLHWLETTLGVADRVS